MSQAIAMSLPRPEDRRRGDLERLLGCAGPLAHWRSEGFAEDLPMDVPLALTAAEAPASHRARATRTEATTWSLGWPVLGQPGLQPGL